MLWVLVFGVIALGGLVMLISYAVWLAHKTADVLSEVQVLSEQAGRLADLVGQLHVPGEQPRDPEVSGDLWVRTGSPS